MNLLHHTEKFRTSSKLHVARSILFSLMSVASLVGIISVAGCTDKAAEIRDQECVNMMDLMNRKARSPNNNDLTTAEKIEKEVNELSDQYNIKCRKKK